MVIFQEIGMKDVNMAGFSIPTRTNMSRTQSQAELESEAPCKRIRRQEGDSCSMQVEMIGPQIDQRPPTRNEDEVLIQMLQTSGAKTYDQVVDFCISCNIPISRMLRLDLMRVIQEPLPPVETILRLDGEQWYHNQPATRM